MFGYVITDKENNVVGVVPSEEFEKYKIVDNIEEYSVGDMYPKGLAYIEDVLKDYSVAECVFINGVNEKRYAFKDYSFCEVGDVVLVETIYGPQIAKVVAQHDRGEWNGHKPEKDIISLLGDYDDYVSRCNMRNELKEKKRAPRPFDEESIKNAENLSDFIAKVFGDIIKWEN